MLSNKVLNKEAFPLTSNGKSEKTFLDFVSYRSSAFIVNMGLAKSTGNMVFERGYFGQNVEVHNKEYIIRFTMVALAYQCDFINQDVRRFKVTREEHFFTRFDLFLAIMIILSITYEVRFSV
jgi:hypothetical protein